jgi:hypothetical protein
MLAKFQHDIALWLQAKTGLTASVFIFVGIAIVAAVMGYVFLCVSAYAWLSVELGPVFGGLATAGFFLVAAVIAFAMAALVRRRTQQRAVLERAAHTRGVSALIDPKVLRLGVRAGRSLGWQRVVSVALLAFLATQWIQEARHHSDGES